MTAPVTLAPGSPGPVVLGDGTTAGGRARGRWRRWRWLVAVAAVLAVGVLASVLPEPATSQVALAPDNPRDQGARAVAQVLEQQGVHITYVRTAREAAAAATAGSTLLVTSDWLLTTGQVEALSATEADLVLLAPSTLLGTAPGLASTWGGSTTPAQVDATCDDPDAQAAGTISAAGTGMTTDVTAGTTDLTFCFPVDGTDASGWLYAVSDGDRHVVALADAGMLTNARIDDAGNAALVLRALGRNAELVWYVPSSDDLAVGEAEQGTDLSALVPPSATVLGLQLLLVVAALALWRGRRLGRVVTEPMPVVVRAAETTRGRARLYRASRSTGHAAAALRAGTAARSAQRLGLPRSAGATDVIDAVARATGRPADEVADLLYGPPPTTDADLEHLVRRLDQLESEVHRT
jgi:hypothetical protein